MNLTPEDAIKGLGYKFLGKDTNPTITSSAKCFTAPHPDTCFIRISVGTAIVYLDWGGGTASATNGDALPVGMNTLPVTFADLNKATAFSASGTFYVSYWGPKGVTG